MRLPQTAEYALRSMAYLALQAGNHPVSGQTLSDATGIPLSYLSKVMRRLVRAGLLTSQKGHGGGFTLVKPPETTSFLEVLNAVEYGIADDRCAFGWEMCDETAPCPLHPAWKSLKTSFYEWASSTMLDTVEPFPED